MLEHPWIDEPDAAALLGRLRASFGPRAMLFPTPAMTGKMLWRQTRDIADYPPMPARIQWEFRNTTGQGRVEMTTAPGRAEVPGLWLYDLRFAYAACCTHLPAGAPVHTGPLPLSDYAKLPAGRYHIRYRVPSNWEHLGLFMTKRARGPGWEYPAEAGAERETWATRTEIRQAHMHGWRVEILHGWMFPNAEGKPRPLDAWRDKLMRIWESSPALAPYVRDILIQTIGAFHAGPTKRITAIAERADDIPNGARDILRLPDRSWQYTTEETADAWRTAYSHPEWTAEIWARCRVRLMAYKGTFGARGALTIPRDDVIAIRTDAIYTAAPMSVETPAPVGFYRLKKHIPGPLPAPTNARDLLRMVKEDE